jgi:hypothetical protein
MPGRPSNFINALYTVLVSLDSVIIPFSRALGGKLTLYIGKMPIM